MSAESKESQPSIDDILSSIREIIADDSAEGGVDQDGAPRSRDAANGHPQSREHAPGSILSVLRGGQAQAAEPGTDQENAPEPAEDVLDLSEEFIVTEATAAIRREQERRAQAEADAQALQDGATDEDAAVAQHADENDDEAALGQTSVWAQDFQMPVGEAGPASPFTAVQTHPESAWPSNDPFDVTESYKLARSQGAGARFARKIDEGPHEAPAPDPEPENAAEPAGDHRDEAGIELTSLSEGGASADPGSAHDQIEFAPEADAALDEVRQPEHHQLRAFPAAAELEAVFGMPPRNPAPTDPQIEDADRFEPGQEPMDVSPQQSTDETASAPPDAHAPVETMPEPHQAAAPEAREPMETTPAPGQGAAQCAPEETSRAPAAPAPATVGGKTLEDSVKELLRPMLQEWLDKNMPRLVEAAMREEVAEAGDQTGSTESIREHCGDEQ